jgi:hypothetical protein
MIAISKTATTLAETETMVIKVLLLEVVVVGLLDCDGTVLLPLELALVFCAVIVTVKPDTVC